MKAVVIVTEHTRSQLAVMELPRPEPGPSDLLVAVKAAGLNRADLARATTHYGHSGPVPEHPIAGLEMAGEVIAVGREVRGFAVGDRVMAMAQRSFAEFVAVDHRLAIAVPPALSWDEAGAFPVVYLTAHDALVTNGGLAAGDAVLIHAVSGGVGFAAVQIASRKGARPILGTSGSPEKVALLKQHGLDAGIDPADGGFADAALALTGNRGVDVILDTVGASALAGNLRCAALGGRIVGVGRMGGRTAEIDLDLLARKRLKLIGVTFRTRSLAEHAAVVDRFRADLGGALADGRLKPVIDRRFPLVETAAAQDYLATNRHVGKVVLTVP
jgi:NADPH2:quinone reductase